MTLLHLCVALLGPLVISLLQHTKLISLLGPVVVSYMLGILFANIPGITPDHEVAKTLTEATVPLAIPLLLFGTDFLRWFRLARTTVISFGLILFSVCLVSFLVSLGFKDKVENFWQIGGMLVGLYTGSTPNLTAVGLSLGVDDNVFLLVNGADLILGASYLLFLLTIGIKIMSAFLPTFKFTGKIEQTQVLTNWDDLNYGNRALNSIILLIMSALILGLGAGISFLVYGKIEAALVILVLTTMGILFSFNVKIRHFKGSYEVGQYLMLVFCTAIGSMANIEQILQGSWTYVLYFAFVLFGSVTLHMILCRLFKIDRDTAIITSVAGIFGPPFIGPIASKLQNREIIVSGLTSGLVGYAVGNYLGIMVAYLLKSL